MSNVDKIAKDLAGIIKNSDSKATTPYDTKATVKKVENGIAWVQIPGGVDETPVQMTLNAKEGDTVQVRVSGGRAWITGNGTAPPTDDARANDAYKAADKAYSVAENAIMDAQRAHEAADSAEASAEQAQTSAENAGEYAARALGNLSTVQSVTETLNWITAHGTMTLTTDTALDPTHVYFVRDNNGDYEVGNYHYSVVTEPKLEDISTYYVLSIDESLNNYVGTHLAVTSEGLWLLPDAGGNKVLIATGGQGHTYEEAGTYIISGSTRLAEFTADGIQVGQTGESHLEMDYHSMKLISKEGSAYFYVSDLRNEDGNIVETFEADGNSQSFTVSFNVSNMIDVLVDGSSQTSGTDYWVENSTVYFVNNPPSGSIVTIVYTTTNEEAPLAKAITFGNRKATGIGACSFSSGIDNEASGYCSHAEGELSHAKGIRSHVEGWSSYADGTDSHAEGFQTRARGNYSHAQNVFTIANGAGQTVIGSANIADTTSLLIIGNGQSPTRRSNALTVDWQGNVDIASGAKYKINGTDLSASDVGAVPTTRKVNNKALSSDITLTATDVSALPISGGTLTGDLTVNGDTTLEGVTYLGLDVDSSASKTTPATSGEDKDLFNAIRDLGWYDDVIV